MNWREIIPFQKKSAIQSSETDNSAICWQAKFDVDDIKPDTRIIVAQGQIALLVSKQTLIGILEEGSYPLSWIGSIDTLSDLCVYYFSSKVFLDQRFGSAAPLIVHTNTDGNFALRAHGTFSYRVDNPKKLWRYIPNGIKEWRTDDLIGELRSLILDQFAIVLNNLQNETKQSFQNRERLSQDLINKLTPLFKNYGLRLEKFLIQSISFPEKEL